MLEIAAIMAVSSGFTVVVVIVSVIGGLCVKVGA